MKIEHTLNKIIYDILKFISHPTSNYGEIDTCQLIFNLANLASWSDEDCQSFEFILKRINVNHKLYLAYDKNGRKSTDLILDQQKWRELFFALLLKYTFLYDEKPSLSPLIARINTVFKAIDLIQPECLRKYPFLYNEIEQKLISLFQPCQSFLKPSHDVITYPAVDTVDEHLKTIPLIILFYEGPIARAYLETIRRLGLKPKKIINLIFSQDLVSKKQVARWLPSTLRKFFVYQIQKNKIHYWPQFLLKKHKKTVNALCSELINTLHFEENTIFNANRCLPLSTYSDTIDNLLIQDLSDPCLHNYLSNQPLLPVLYTGGGMVSERLLSISNIPFIHIHPGFLPNIRGADCTLWSIFLTGHTSATCFHLSPGIDEGNIIKSCWLPKLILNDKLNHLEVSIGYRLIYSFIDPWVRSFLLRELLKNHHNLAELPTSTQIPEGGNTFHFMHHKIKKIVLGCL
ncbi:MAG: hypothetical protein A3F12_02965 [Gammaproteobacteria bacterium RIFCSPHIGHO2_12_FULL_38_14]|nr:MAG: hypothetical protein A3F12_02965 [Gammaproteobacteria bacterium RIFCSPHIGHO2_12_FULL_38_14]